MRRLNNKHIVLGVTGGIAAYKAAEVVRRFKEAGAHVRVVMTKAGQSFITPLTMQALSGNPVHTDLLDTEAEAAMGHIELARWADLMVIAPASANLMSRLAQGRADDLLTAICLATTAPIALAPAMNQAMWGNTSTQSNLATLKDKGITILGPAEGSQACGETGLGRMLEPDQIALSCAELFTSRALDGVQVVITAGPTQEAIDPVRFISNRSSGKMGFALADAAVNAGAAVTLIAGPVALATPERVKRIDIISAEQMHQAALAQLNHCDIFISSAAVADYRPVELAQQKIKKSATTITLELTRNPDIVAAVASHEKRPFTVGFAAETEQLINHARSKLVNKNLDLIIANDVANTNIGFNSDQNAVTLLWNEGRNEEQGEGELVLPTTSKQQLARLLIKHIAEHYRKETPRQQG
jgi:phosphopantothenoylcysteine decarboxylase/phosphopantothenate--cysteine ligase